VLDDSLYVLSPVRLNLAWARVGSLCEREPSHGVHCHASDVQVIGVLERKDDNPNSLWYMVEGRIQMIQTTASGREVLSAFRMPGGNLLRGGYSTRSTLSLQSGRDRRLNGHRGPGFALQIPIRRVAGLCQAASR